MKTLYVLRHGQAAPETQTISDHERPLTPRGRAEAEQTAEHLAARGNLPSLVICSSATRALQTAEQCLATWSDRAQLQVVDDLYLAGPSSYLRALALGATAHDRVMVVGHNPGLESLVQVLTERSEHLATASLVEIELSLAGWGDLESSGYGSGRLVHAYRG